MRTKDNDILLTLNDQDARSILYALDYVILRRDACMSVEAANEVFLQQINFDVIEKMSVKLAKVLGLEHDPLDGFDSTIAP